MNKYLEQLNRASQTYNNMLNLTCNENIMSLLAQTFHNTSSLSNRYNLGPGEDGVLLSGPTFGAKGMPEVADIVAEARMKANEMLNSSVVSLNLLSGIHAMMSSLLSCSSAGDVVMTVPPGQGGHFCTKGILDQTGRGFVPTEYDFENLTFDVEKLAKSFKASGATTLYLDTSALLKPHPLREIRQALGEDAIIIYDASHTLGLIMAGEFQDPLLEGANVISANTHKTLPGPHKGLIAFRDKEWGLEKDKVISTSFYSTVHTTNQLALAITIIEFYEYGKQYARQLLTNANALAASLEAMGLRVRRADKDFYTRTHQVHVFTDLERKTALRLFLDNNISLLTSSALGTELFFRLGVQELTMRGMCEAEMKTIAEFICQVLNGENIGGQVSEFIRQFPVAHYGFGL